jgi:hypothetical protein
MQINSNKNSSTPPWRFSLYVRSDTSQITHHRLRLIKRYLYLLRGPKNLNSEIGKFYAGKFSSFCFSILPRPRPLVTLIFISDLKTFRKPEFWPAIGMASTSVYGFLVTSLERFQEISSDGSCRLTAQRDLSISAADDGFGLSLYQGVNTP